MNNIIKYSNLKVLDEQEASSLKSIVEKEYDKIVKLLPEPSDLIVDVKVAHKDKNKRYMISLRLETASKIYTTKSKDTNETADYDLVKAAHKICTHLYNEVSHSVGKDKGNTKKKGIKELFKIFKN